MVSEATAIITYHHSSGQVLSTTVHSRNSLMIITQAPWESQSGQLEPEKQQIL